MDKTPENTPLIKKPGAWIPLVMSLAALIMVLGYVAAFGIIRHQDEAAPARIFQLIMLAQLPVAGWFAVRWLPVRPSQALFVLALQAAAWLIPVLAVIGLENLQPAL